MPKKSEFIFVKEIWRLMFLSNKKGYVKSLFIRICLVKLIYDPQF